MIPINEIMNTLPHRYPFLLVDRVTELEPRSYIKGFKNVTINEPFFPGHFPGQPIMPGVLIIEAMAQIAGILAYRSGIEGKSMYFMSIEHAKFRRPVIPGDQIFFEIRAIKQRGPVWKFQGSAMVDDKVVAEAEITAMITDREI
ncbi:MAG: 3-hydroxyacyl-[acyl-carrier-protein] dehydratase FabZ [Thermodesulfovibrio sp.]|nr:3-hydroxyacyl-[acyl-carrier-protein] dehydratase FabZ [Thermodesulfovibrio sp.]